MAAAESADPTPPSSNGVSRNASKKARISRERWPEGMYVLSSMECAETQDAYAGAEQRLPAAYLRQLKAQHDAAAGGAGAAASQPHSNTHPHIAVQQQTQQSSLMARGHNDGARRQIVQLSPQQLEQITQQHAAASRQGPARKWGKTRKGDESDDRCGRPVPHWPEMDLSLSRMQREMTPGENECAS